MSGTNRVTILGHVAADPEHRQAGKSALVTFRVAVTETWRRGKESGESTEFIPIKCWGDGLCDMILNNVRKGDKVFVEGKFKTEKFEQNGSTRYSTSVVVQGFDGKVEFWKRAAGSGGARRDDGDGRQSSSHHGGQRAPAAQIDDPFDTEIPF